MTTTETSYRVITPYVTLRVMDHLAGSWNYRGFHEGAVLPADTNQEDIERHLRKTMIEKVEGSDAKLVESQRADEEKAREEAAEALHAADEAAAKKAAEDANPTEEAAAAAKDEADAADARAAKRAAASKTAPKAAKPADPPAAS